MCFKRRGGGGDSVGNEFVCLTMGVLLFLVVKTSIRQIFLEIVCWVFLILPKN